MAGKYRKEKHILANCCVVFRAAICQVKIADMLYYVLNPPFSREGMMTRTTAEYPHNLFAVNEAG